MQKAIKKLERKRKVDAELVRRRFRLKVCLNVIRKDILKADDLKWVSRARKPVVRCCDCEESDETLDRLGNSNLLRTELSASLLSTPKLETVGGKFKSPSYRIKCTAAQCSQISVVTVYVLGKRRGATFRIGHLPKVRVEPAHFSQVSEADRVLRYEFARKLPRNFKRRVHVWLDNFDLSIPLASKVRAGAG